MLETIIALGWSIFLSGMTVWVIAYGFVLAREYRSVLGFISMTFLTILVILTVIGVTLNAYGN